MTKKKRGCGLIIVLVLTATLIFGVRWAWKYYRLPSLPDRKEYKTLEERSDKALAYAKAHNMSEKYALFVDYGLPSGTPRMFMWDFEKQEVIATTYVMHGPGGGSTAERARFSNKPGSKCSALGRFMVTRDHGIRLTAGLPVRVCAGASLLLPYHNAISRNPLRIDGSGGAFGKVVLSGNSPCALLEVRDVFESTEWTTLPNGTYGATGSGAEFVRDDLFAGTGVLTVGAWTDGTVIMIR